ncbi:MAG: hypothetical protein EBZ00_06750 [Actinobacteria bacterium]|nr:hypothetical protein [Actinomycetota bacterium]
MLDCANDNADGVVDIGPLVQRCAKGGIAGGEYGLKGALYFAASGLVLGFIVALFLKETAPRKTGGL